MGCGASFKSAKGSLGRYTEPYCIWEALETETAPIRLVRASWLISANQKRWILARRQELPEDAFITVNELRKMYSDSNRHYNADGVLPVIAISFCWLTQMHPDPEGQVLATVAGYLEREMSKYNDAGFADMGIFWDWLSLYQNHANGERTEEEKKAFKFALHDTMDLWYAHQGTIIYMITKLPKDCTRPHGYLDSGWTTYERCSAEQIKKDVLWTAGWKLVNDLCADEGTESEKRNWPVGPDEFEDLIETKNFTNGADKGDVKDLYRKMSLAQLGSIEQLEFLGMQTPTLEDGLRLSGCLKLCKRLKKLMLTQCNISDTVCKAIFSSLAEGALPHCQELRLDFNQIGSEGLRALTDAIAQGALPSCKTLLIFTNPCTADKEAVEALKSTWKKAGRPWYGLDCG